MSDSTWTEVTTREGHRAWTAWDAEQADCGALVVLEHDPEWCKPWVATSTFDGDARIGTTAREALDGIGCGLTPPDTFPRTLRRNAERPEPDDRPVMAWWVSGDGWWYVSPTTGTAGRLGSTPHPTALAKAMGWRAVEVSRD